LYLRTCILAVRPPGAPAAAGRAARCAGRPLLMGALRLDALAQPQL